MTAPLEPPIRIGFVTQIFPWVTQTFTYNEMLSWVRAGLDVEPIAFRKPRPGVRGSFGAPKYFAPRAAQYTSAFGFNLWLSGLGLAARHPFVAASTLALVATRPYEKRTTLRLRATAIWSWARALPIAALARQRDYEILHADFADQTATSSWVASQLTGIPFSFRSHGSFNPQLLDKKVRAAALVLCISEYDRKMILEKSGTGAAEKLIVSYVGVDLDSWGPPPREASTENPAILCVGTLQEKKGQRYLIDACAMLHREGLEFRCTLMGDGPDKEMLQQMISNAGLDAKVQITGYLPGEDVRAATLKAMVVCLPCVVAENGDQDGLPVVLMEGMAAGKPCVSTPVAGITELIVHESTGLLVPERDARALADALRRLLADTDLRRRLGMAARQCVEARFDLWRNGRTSADFLLERSRHAKRARPYRSRNLSAVEDA